MLRVAGSSAKVLGGAINAFRGINTTNAVRNFSIKPDFNEFFVQVLDSEVKNMQLMASAIGSSWFPFQTSPLCYYVDDREITLTRELEGEKIEITITDDSIESESEKPTKSVDYLKVEISKGDSGNKKSMNFSVTASADQIQIHSLFTRLYRDNSHQYIQLEEESDVLQSGFREFLEKRGIHKSITGFLYDYMLWKSKLSHLYMPGPEFVTVEAYFAGKMGQPNTVESLTKLKQVIQGW